MRKHRSLDLFQTLYEASVEETLYEASVEEVNEMELKEGQVLGEKERYEVVKRLGIGGMGIVYLVKDKMLENDLMALKIILGKLLKEERARQRFRNEIRIARKLKHKSILTVYDYGEYKNLMYYTMEYVDGKNMREWMEEKEDMVLWEELWEITRQILEGLEVAHEETVHRDIKPENILLEQKGQIIKARICDFGLAQLKSPSVLLTSMQAMGTYNYMAPEQMEDASHVDRRADLYSIGVMLYECLTKKLPVGKFRSISRIREDISQELGQAIEKALEAEKEDRYESAREMLDALVPFLARERQKKEEKARLAREEEAREKQAVLAKEEEARKAALLRARQEQEAREKQAALAREEEARKAALLRARQEQEAREKQAALAREEEAKKAALLRAQQEKKEKEQQEALARQEQEAREKQAALAREEEAKKAALLRARQEKRDKERQEALARQEQEAREKQAMQEQEEWQSSLVHGEENQEEEKPVQSSSPQPEENKAKRKSYAALWILLFFSLCAYGLYQSWESQEQERLNRLAKQKQEREAELARKQEQERLNRLAREEENRQAELASKQSRPKASYGLPDSVWENCKYSHQGEWILDMASSHWGSLGFQNQVKYASAYQEGYARAKGLEIEKSFSGITMRLIPPGRFWMGSPDGERDRSSNEGPRHPVIISKAFYVGKYEVTQGQWQSVMGNNPAYFKNAGNNAPIETVSWDSCNAFLEKSKLRFLTEAEWEYACRAGTTTPFNLGNNITPDQVNYDGNYPYADGQKGVYRQTTVACGSLPNANAWGCYDFHGNVYEWCQDNY
ncbi:MAG: SUMF1/EgtB/PvdO family nonheme iron enzyme, partial [Candidatus Brocadiae bacterium]|nr:SUMF1/EgtB/PvdO family nonheme iron enzyme [Candidatus Brocadiia bacterium]